MEGGREKTGGDGQLREGDRGKKAGEKGEEGRKRG